MTRRICSVLAITLLLTIGFVSDATKGAMAQSAGGTPATPATGATGGTGQTGETGGTQSCNWDALKASICRTESGPNCDYAARSPNSSAKGRYQFIASTQAALIARYTDCNASTCQGEAIREQRCWPVQECLMDRLLAENLRRARNSSACRAAIGQTVTGSGQGRTLTCQVTEAGVLAVMHLLGNCNNIGGTDANNTSGAYYACRHGSNAIPGNCTPSGPPAAVASGTDPNLQSPPATQAQMDARGEVEGSHPFPLPIESIIDPLIYWWVAGLQLMAEQFTASMMAQVQGIGMLFDAKHQLETQRIFQQKTAEAHKDYQPSEQMCTFGTFARDLAATERSANLTKTALSQEVLQRELGSGNSKGYSQTSDSLSRIATFRTRFCNPSDNANGLSLLCPSPPPQDMRNRDINYTQTIDQPLSLQINLVDNEVTPDEEAAFALIDNLFAHRTLPRVPQTALEQRKFQYHYMNLRSVVAMRGVARNSMANILAMKTATPNKEDAASSAPYIRALMREFGLQDEEITKLLGPNPSYHAQMEALTKKIYQNPVFYTNLYDKPANVKRIRAAMKAVKLMQDRDIQAALVRREMLMSMMLELRLREKANDVYNAAEGSLFTPQ